jgi:uncharacterized repeat protein (TIGR03803 family)
LFRTEVEVTKAKRWNVGIISVVICVATVMVAPAKTLKIPVSLEVASHALPVQETILYAFPQYGNPQGAMVSDGTGNLYGTTRLGGSNPVNCSNGAGCGTVFELSPPSQQGGPWTETVLYEFQGGSDGDRPACTPVIDRYGNLYGTSEYYISQSDYGAVVWELSRPTSGGAWNFTELYSMPSVDLGNIGFSFGNLIMDKSGNLYGTTTSGGTGCPPFGCGMVYEVSPPQQSGGTWTGNVIYTFSGAQNFTTRLAMDKEGALYGGAGTQTSDITYQLVPPSQPGGSWTENVIYTFDALAAFEGGLVFDREGNLYGASVDGPLDQGCQNRQGCGYVFELSPPQSGGAWTETVLYSFLGKSDGWYPAAIPILDPKGNLYGTTYEGGRDNLGTVYRLTKGLDGTWGERRFSLAGNSPTYPTGSLILGPGTAVTGTGTGAFGGGGVFSIGIQ